MINALRFRLLACVLGPLVLGCGDDLGLFPSSGSAGAAGASAGGAGGEGGQGGGGQGSGAGGPCSSDVDCVALGDACHLGQCKSGACALMQQPDGTPCQDGLYCTDGDICSRGTCFPGPPMSCASDDDPCHAGICNEAIDACVVGPGNDGAPCDDGDACTEEGYCSAGACAPGEPVDCSALGGPCTAGVCDPSRGCVATPANEGAACNDGQHCTDGDHCSAGECTGAPKVCAVPIDQPCMVGLCDEADNLCILVPGNDGAPCEDGSICTASDTCGAGSCQGGSPANEGASCNDGSACTLGDACTAGSCVGTVGGFDVYFVEDFSDNSQGWTLGQEWEIAPAQLSPAGAGYPDPETDHSPTADDGVAGVEIGGLASTSIHAYRWLESPSFDTSTASGAVVLSFWRWLNSDYAPWMDNAIEVFDGVNWVEVWSSGSDQIADDTWTFQQHDITTLKNSQMRIRFGHKVGQGGAFEMSSWNLDDIMVAAGACQ